MRNRVALENIEELRRREGIDDLELLDEIHSLKVGDVVMLTLLAGTGSSAGESLPVRITRIRKPPHSTTTNTRATDTAISGSAPRNSSPRVAVFEFLGRLTASPSFRMLAALKAGSRVRFTAAHIHSIWRRGRSRESPKGSARQHSGNG